MNKGTKIYALVEPSTGSLGYVGSTRLKASERLRHHLRRAAGGDRACDQWVRALADQGVVPELVELETVTDSWQEAVSFWSEYLRSMGAQRAELGQMTQSRAA